MLRRIAIAIATTAALALPAVAIADAIAPHSSFYSQHPMTPGAKPSNNVTVYLHRNTGKVLVGIGNFCLGSTLLSGPGVKPTRYPDSASVQTRVRGGRMSFRGMATVYAGQTHSRRVRTIFAAKMTAKAVTGSAKFPGTKCGTIRFVAHLRERTK